MSKYIKIGFFLSHLFIVVLVIGSLIVIDGIMKQEWDRILNISLYSLGLVVLLFLLNFFTIKLFSTLGTEQLEFIEAEDMDSEVANSALAYILPFVSLSIDIHGLAIAFITFGIIIITFFITNMIYLNPFLYFMGYRVYKVKAQSGISYKLISKRKYKLILEEILPIEIFNGLYFNKQPKK